MFWSMTNTEINLKLKMPIGEAEMDMFRRWIVDMLDHSC